MTTIALETVTIHGEKRQKSNWLQCKNSYEFIIPQAQEINWIVMTSLNLRSQHVAYSYFQVFNYRIEGFCSNTFILAKSLFHDLLLFLSRD